MQLVAGMTAFNDPEVVYQPAVPPMLVAVAEPREDPVTVLPVQAYTLAVNVPEPPQPEQRAGADTVLMVYAVLRLVANTKARYTAEPPPVPAKAEPLTPGEPQPTLSK